MHLEVDTMFDPVYLQGVPDVTKLDLQRCVVKLYAVHAPRTTL